MPQNKLIDLNNHLFAALERLDIDVEDANIENLQLEIQKAQAVSKVAAQIINTNKLVLDAAKLISQGHLNKENCPKTLLIEP